MNIWIRCYLLSVTVFMCVSCAFISRGSDEECLCPDELPWPNYKLFAKNGQEFCGKELLHMVPNITCSREAIYQCKEGERRAYKMLNCMQYRTGRSSLRRHCAPSTEQDCILDSEWHDKGRLETTSCLRQRYCGQISLMDRKIAEYYGQEI